MKKQKLETQILHCLEKYPDTRNDDIVLTRVIWQVFYSHLIQGEGKSKFVLLIDLNKLPREDNVKRIRAKIQNEQKKFPPTEYAVAKKRGWAEQEWRNYLGYGQKRLWNE
jgi:hypothetical protein